MGCFFAVSLKYIFLQFIISQTAHFLSKANKGLYSYICLLSSTDVKKVVFREHISDCSIVCSVNKCRWGDFFLEMKRQGQNRQPLKRIQSELLLKQFVWMCKENQYKIQNATSCKADENGINLIWGLPSKAPL